MLTFLLDVHIDISICSFVATFNANKTYAKSKATLPATTATFDYVHDNSDDEIEDLSEFNKAKDPRVVEPVHAGPGRFRTKDPEASDEDKYFDGMCMYYHVS